MKSQLTSLSLVLFSALCISTTLATNEKGDLERTTLNKVRIINNSGKDIAYVIISDSSNSDLVYGVKAKKTDTYHAKATGDVNATMKVAACNKINKVTRICNEYADNSLKNCVGDARYDFYKINSIKINSNGACIITCNDGGKTSCLAP